MSTDIYLIYQLDAGLINQQNLDERFEVSKCVLGYFDGTETEVIEYCKTVGNSIPNRYQVKEENEYIWYPIIGYNKLAKLNVW